MRSCPTAALPAIALAALVVAAPGAAAATPKACAKAPAAKTVPYERVAGVPANLTSLDVYAPSRACRKGRRTPVVMWVHGGAYAVGDKRNQIRDKVRLFSRRGWVFVSVNYRLTRPGTPRSAKYPDHFRDVAAAVSWVRRGIGRRGGDRGRIALLGHSAGADIVANVTTNPRWLRERKLGLSAVRCAGPLDTEGFDKAAAGPGEQGQWQRALGNLPTYVRDTSAVNLLRRGAGIPRTITVFRGTPRRQRIERRFVTTLRAAGVPATLVDARSLSHAEVSRRIGAAGDRVMTPPLLRFLGGCFNRR
ncbi:MAG TPA: alpha/beta hydrolase [Thermoleophilaceae bacterium]|nr:alpha/beta hydrolase [Thermoleophilaceae bacterium]